VEQILEALAEDDGAIKAKGVAALEWLKDKDGEVEAAATIAVGNTLDFLYDATNSDADKDGIPDSEEKDRNEDTIPDELHKALRATLTASRLLQHNISDEMKADLKEFGNTFLGKITIKQVPLPKSWAEFEQNLADAKEDLELGLALAYGVLLLMAIVPIYVGAHRSLTAVGEMEAAGEEIEIMTSKDAAMFPVYASCALFGMYMMFKVFGKEYVNMVLGGYFFLLGSASLASMLRPVGEMVSPKWFEEEPFELNLSRTVTAKAAVKAEGDKPAEEAVPAGPEDWFKLKFDLVDLVCVGMAAVVGVWYLLTKNWIATNLYGLSFAINGISMFALPSFPTGCILLSGLFFYDVFWVFGTDVMVTVARSFDAPIKVLFPKDFLQNHVFATELAMLGLGDIVLPGIVIALLLRYDVNKGRTSKPYFWCVYFAYIFGLVFTIVVMHTYKSAQPALLYLVPAVLLTPIALAVVRGELSDLFAYNEEELAEEAKKEDTKDKKAK
jgi:minor histocompatibility antigen H13